MRETDEPTRLLRDNHSLAAVTERGGIRLLHAAALQPVASETAVGEGWNQRVALPAE
jgi:hypothetical protein